MIVRRWARYDDRVKQLPCTLVGLFMAVSCLSAGNATASRHDPPIRSLESIIAVLIEEANAAREAGQFAHDEPSFATRCDPPPRLEEIRDAIMHRQHEDGFVDAYIRWQLTSFDPPPPELDDAAFLDAMDATPPLLENPNAAPALLDLMGRVEAAGALSAENTEKLRRHVEGLNDQVMRIEELNRPAREWRAWVAEHLGDTGARPRLWMVENLAAHISAGWPVSELKGDLSRNFTDSVKDQGFTAEGRQAVVLALSRLIGPGRKYFHDLTYRADGSVSVTLRTAAVDREDVETWRRRLAGIRVD